MSCNRWTASQLLPKAELISHLLIENALVNGVALSGSLARLESNIHDIDLVILHNGSMNDGSSTVPEGIKKINYDNEVILSTAVGGILARRIDQVRGEVPLNLIFVHEKALWDCQYLASLEKKESFSGFYLTLFCQIPLVLLNPGSQRGGVKQYTEDMEIGNLKPTIISASYSGISLKHRCGNPNCRPKQSWEERQREIKKRKGHTWHD